jgi:hypothetical protein
MKNELNPIWLKAAVTGGLWASFEIIVGSLLHNLHLPFSGTLLATFSVILMISFIQIWNENGLIWRAGLICGLMKSLSPSAVILGPMTGIMMEALFMDLLIFLLGRNVFGYMMAGVAALLSAILHKLASLFILYGNDLLTIYLNLFRFLKKQLGLQEAEPVDLILTIVSIYVVVGALAALTGFLIGQRARKDKAKGDIPIPLPDPFASTWEHTNPDRPFRLALFFIHLILIPVLLILINRFGLHPFALIPSGFYLAALLIYYRRILNRLKKPFFWSQLLLMTLIAGVFWRPPEGSDFKFDNGFLVGLEMSLRAILIVSTFSALSVEIRNPRIINQLIKKGFGNAHAALSLAFNSLPVMLDRSAEFKGFIRNPWATFTALVIEAELWLESYQKHYNS